MSEIKLSKRMQTVADMVEGAVVADIGCDHAFVSIHLVQSGKAKKVIAMDVKKGPVNIAKSNITTYGLDKYIEVRLSNGFDSLNVGEADCAVIAGMGGILMVNILEKGIGHINSGINLVLQPQSDIYLVRKFLSEYGYSIADEEMLIEDDKYYTVIKAKPVSCSSVSFSEEELLFGPVLLAKKDVTLKKYLMKAHKNNCELIDRLFETNTDKSQARIKVLEKDNSVILKALAKYTK